ncbi:MAG: hypothetical protein IKB02_03870 [Clostridia bacterium]|nr:hypothetical protein [Clostridia bacterium]
MKKLLSIMLVAIMLFAVAMPAVAAEEAEGTVIEPAKDMAVYYANDLTGQTLPVIDGTINPGEYGNVITIAEPVPMAETWPEYGYVIDLESTRQRSGQIEFYFAYDETSMYIAFKEYGAKYEDGNTAYNDFQSRSNYGFAYGFQLDDMTNYLSHGVTYGGGCWNKNFTFSDGKLSNFSSTEVAPDQFYSELFVHKYKADEASLPEDERTLWVYGDVLSASNQNASAQYIMEVEMRLDKQQVIEVFNSVAYTEYAECPNAMYFMMSANVFRLLADGTTATPLGGHNRYLVTDISKYNDAQKTKFYMDYGMLPGSPSQILPALIVFDKQDAPIMIPADKVETEPEETEPEVTEPEVTEAPTNENPTEAPEIEAPAAEGGCGSSVALAGIALVAALSTCTAFVAKKKED